MWVKITAGPKWAIGKNAQLVDDELILLILWNEFGEPHWYPAADFEWVNLERSV